MPIPRVFYYALAIILVRNVSADPASNGVEYQNVSNPNSGTYMNVPNSNAGNYMNFPPTNPAGNYMNVSPANPTGNYMNVAPTNSAGANPTVYSTFPNPNTGNYAPFTNPNNPFISNSPTTPVYSGNTALPVVPQGSAPTPYQNPLSGFRHMNSGGTGAANGGAPAISTSGAERSYSELMNARSVNRNLSSVTLSIAKQGTEAQSTALSAIGHLTTMRTHLGQVKANLNRANSFANSDPYIAGVTAALLSKLQTEFALAHMKIDAFEASYKKVNDAVRECATNASREANAAAGNGNAGAFGITAKKNAATANEGVAQMNTIQLSFTTFATRLAADSMTIRENALRAATSQPAGTKAIATTLINTVEQAGRDMKSAVSDGNNIISKSTRASELANLTAQNAGSISNSLNGNPAVIPR